MLFCVVFPGNSEVTLSIAPYFENTWPEVSYKSAISLTFSVKGDTQRVHPLVFNYSKFFFCEKCYCEMRTLEIKMCHLFFYNKRLIYLNDSDRN